MILLFTLQFLQFSLISRKWKLNRKLTPTVPLEELLGVTILKPVVGVDPHLYENLETFFNIKYPQVRFYQDNYIPSYLGIIIVVIQEVMGSNFSIRYNNVLLYI